MQKEMGLHKKNCFIFFTNLVNACGSRVMCMHLRRFIKYFLTSHVNLKNRANKKDCPLRAAFFINRLYTNVMLSLKRGINLTDSGMAYV
jgi:hypothetical protein